MYYEDDNDALEYESDTDKSEDESENEDDDHNNLYDDALYGAKRLRIEDESLELTDEQKKVIANLKRMNKKYVNSFVVVYSFYQFGSSCELWIFHFVPCIAYSRTVCLKVNAKLMQS